MTGRRNMIYGGGGAPDQGTPASHTIIPSSSIPTEPLFLSTPSSSPSFLGSRSMVSFEDVNGRKRQERPFFGSFDDDNNNGGEEEYDEYFNQPEKKRRLTADQVQFLEKSFEVENKLEPERKVQLAKDLGLQPRQVAIWFQNRRARWKTKQMEKDYDVLQSSYNKLKADYDGLIKEKEKLNAEVLHLNEKLLLQQNEKTDSDNSDTIPAKSPSSGRADESASEGEISKNLSVSNKIEQTCSTKSDSLDSDSPRYADGGHSYVDQSDLSQDEEDNLSNTCVLAPPPYTFPKLENYDYQDPSTFSCLYEFAAEDQHIDFWSYSNPISDIYASRTCSNVLDL